MDKEKQDKLLAVLKEIAGNKPVQFIDEDCDGGLYNFGGVVEENDTVIIKLYMWEDPHGIGRLA